MLQVKLIQDRLSPCLYGDPGAFDVYLSRDPKRYIRNRKIKATKTKFGEREDAILCSLKCEKIILRNIIQYDLATIKFIFRYATKELKTKLVSKIEKIQSKSPISEVLSKIECIKKELPKNFQFTEVQNIEVKQEVLQELPVNEEIVQKSFLETIFETNTPEYNQNLFHILVEGLKTIDKEDIYQQAKFLLKFNNSITNNKFENLNSVFYYKATDKYKFRLWFEKLTDYCSTEIGILTNTWSYWSMTLQMPNFTENWTTFGEDINTVSLGAEETLLPALLKQSTNFIKF